MDIINDNLLGQKPRFLLASASASSAPLGAFARLLLHVLPSEESRVAPKPDLPGSLAAPLAV